MSEGESQVCARSCRGKMRMSGLCKVEMSGFILVGGGGMETERIELSARERERLKVLQQVEPQTLTSGLSRKPRKVAPRPKTR